MKLKPKLFQENCPNEGFYSKAGRPHRKENGDNVNTNPNYVLQRDCFARVHVGKK